MFYHLTQKPPPRPLPYLAWVFPFFGGFPVPWGPQSDFALASARKKKTTHCVATRAGLPRAGMGTLTVPGCFDFWWPSGSPQLLVWPGSLILYGGRRHPDHCRYIPSGPHLLPSCASFFLHLSCFRFLRPTASTLMAEGSPPDLRSQSNPDT